MIVAPPNFNLFYQQAGKKSFLLFASKDSFMYSIQASIKNMRLILLPICSILVTVQLYPRAVNFTVTINASPAPISPYSYRANPNPFNLFSKIEYALPDNSGIYRMEIINVMGRVIKTY
jgi:hypothetical protein